jgi:hypothetical protein
MLATLHWNCVKTILVEQRSVRRVTSWWEKPPLRTFEEWLDTVFCSEPELMASDPNRLLLRS